MLHVQGRHLGLTKHAASKLLSIKPPETLHGKGRGARKHRAVAHRPRELRDFIDVNSSLLRFEAPRCVGIGALKRTRHVHARRARAWSMRGRQKSRPADNRTHADEQVNGGMARRESVMSEVSRRDRNSFCTSVRWPSAGGNEPALLPPE